MADDDYAAKHRRPEGTHQGTRGRPWQKPEPREPIGQPTDYNPKHARKDPPK